MSLRHLLVSFLSLAAALPIPLQAAKNNKATAELLAAVAEGKEADITAALKAGADPNAKDEEGTPALGIVSANTIWGDDKAVIDAFKKAKANFEATNKLGQTPLMLATRAGKYEIADALIADGSKVNAKDADGWTPLMYAAINGETSIAKALMGAKANIELGDKDGWTPFLIAIQYGKGSVADQLVQAGAKVPEKTPDGQSLIVLAAYSRDLAAMRVALEGGGDINATDSDGWSSLAITSYNGDEQTVMDLLRSGADQSLKDKEGKTALDRAIENKNGEIVALLGGKWDKPKPKGGTTISVPCPALGGKVEGNIAVDGKALVFTTSYPKPLSWYIGGGNVNRAKTAKKFTYEGSIDPGYYFDLDGNAKTGIGSDSMDKGAVGSEYSLTYSQYGTSITLHYKDSKGTEKQKQVFANILSATVKKGDESVDLSSLAEDDYPVATNDLGVLKTRVPLSLLGLEGKKSVKVTTAIGDCGPVVTQLKLK